jgi:hypothetical protein
VVVKQGKAMPEISRFLAIIIRMYLREHAPAHFHAEYGEYEITVDIETGVVNGRFPRRALSAVLDGYVLHQGELMANWQAALDRKPLSKIAPLE